MFQASEAKQFTLSALAEIKKQEIKTTVAKIEAMIKQASKDASWSITIELPKNYTEVLAIVKDAGYKLTKGTHKDGEAVVTIDWNDIS